MCLVILYSAKKNYEIVPEVKLYSKILPSQHVEAASYVVTNVKTVYAPLMMVSI
jgi:hypothetical protein